MSHFITFEGTEGSGKSTQIDLTSAWLSGGGISHVVTREPGGTEAGEEIRRLLLHRKDVSISPVTEIALFTAARNQLLQEVILPAIERGTWVLCDRFVDSTICYQGYGRGAGEEMVRAMHGIIGNTMPGITFFFDLPVEEGLDRLGKGTRDRFESMDYSFHRRVREGYLILAKKEPQRLVLLDGRLPVDQLQEKIRETITQRCNVFF